jgi:hypothetical protein
MRLQNPFLHYPKYIARIIFIGGGATIQNGISYPEVNILCDEENIAAICWAAIEANDECEGAAMYYDGAWHEYNEELANQLEYPNEDPVEPESYICPLTTESMEGESMVNESQEEKEKT